jgi:basic amino acid/polyamine antiporter, APA family
VSLAGAFACLYTMLGLPRTAWERFGIWLVIGAVVYVAYGYRHSRMRESARGVRP